MPQVLPSAGQYLAQPLAQIAGAITKVIQPQREFQDNVLRAITENPALIQQFADLEASNPGTLQRLGIGALAQFRPSIDAEFTAKNRQAILEGKTKQLEQQTAATTYSTDQINRALSLIKEKPDIAMDAALRMVTGQTGAERRTSEARATSAESDARVATGTEEARLEIMRAQKSQAEFQSRMIEKQAELMNMGPQVMMQRFLSKDNPYTNEEMAAIFSGPLGSALKAQLDVFMDQQRINAMGRNDGDAMARLRESQAFELWQASGFQGSFQDALSFRDKPTGARESDLAKGLGKADEARRLRLLNQTSRDLTTAISKYQNLGPGKTNDELRKAIVSEIQGILDQRAEAGLAPQYTVTFEEIDVTGPWNKHGLVWRDAKNNIVSPDDAFKKATAKPIRTFNFAAMKKDYDAFKTAGEKAAWLEQAKADMTPVEYTKLEQTLGIK